MGESKNAVQDPAQEKLPLKFVAYGRAVKHGSVNVAAASSTTMARRIANALNQYKPHSRGY